MSFQGFNQSLVLSAFFLQEAAKASS